ncbi:MAG: hypothetical protein ACE5GX_11320 [Thermoanaerobaculia bacterium]
MNRPRSIPTVPLLVAALVTALLTALAPTGAGAWTKETHVEIARRAATIAPPDLLRQIKRNEKAFLAGLSSSWAEHGRSTAASGLNGRHVLGQIEAGANAAVAAIESHRPFNEIVRNLGRLAIHAADANNPLLHSAADPEESKYGGNYQVYVASAVPRFPVIFYGQGRDIRTSSALTTLIRQMESRSVSFYPVIGREYRRIGSVDGVRLFDDKSTAFGVGSIAFSHAVSDLAAIYRYVWLRSGGADRRELPVTLPAAATDPQRKQRGR